MRRFMAGILADGHAGGLHLHLLMSEPQDRTPSAVMQALTLDPPREPPSRRNPHKRSLDGAPFKTRDGVIAPGHSPNLHSSRRKFIGYSPC